MSWILAVWMLGPALSRAGFDEIVLIDFPGFSGRLALEKCYPTLDLLFDATGDLFDWLEPHTLLGHSLGGWLCARYAADCGAGARPRNRRRHGYDGPEHVMLVASAGVYESVEIREAIGQVFAELTGEGGFEVLRPHLFAREPFWFNWIARDFSQFATDEGIRQFTASVREDHLLQARLGDIRAKTWLIWGDRDTLVPTAGYRTWLDGLSGASQAVLIKGVGHSPQLEKPAVTAAVISRILLSF